jgi:hypothetical protein
MNIVLVEINTGDGVEAEAFKTVDSFKEYIGETFDEESSQDLISQLDEQLNDGYDIVDLNSSEFIEIKAFTKYGIY